MHAAAHIISDVWEHPWHTGCWATPGFSPRCGSDPVSSWTQTFLSAQHWFQRDRTWIIDLIQLFNQYDTTWFLTFKVITGEIKGIHLSILRPTASATTGPEWQPILGEGDNVKEVHGDHLVRLAHLLVGLPLCQASHRPPSWAASGWSGCPTSSWSLRASSAGSPTNLPSFLQHRATSLSSSAPEWLPTWCLCCSRAWRGRWRRGLPRSGSPA